MYFISLLLSTERNLTKIQPYQRIVELLQSMLTAIFGKRHHSWKQFREMGIQLWLEDSYSRKSAMVSWMSSVDYFQSVSINEVDTEQSTSKNSTASGASTSAQPGQNDEILSASHNSKVGPPVVAKPTNSASERDQLLEQVKSMQANMKSQQAQLEELLQKLSIWVQQFRANVCMCFVSTTLW